MFVLTLSKRISQSCSLIGLLIKARRY